MGLCRLHGYLQLSAYKVYLRELIYRGYTVIAAYGDGRCAHSGGVGSQEDVMGMAPVPTAGSITGEWW